MKGWVYVISNPSMPGIVKIGYSSKDPKLRAEELYTTGVPRPFEVNYSLLVDDPYDLEQRIHKSLKHINDGKEWFKCSVEEAIATIRYIYNGNIYHEEYKNADKENAAHVIAKINADKEKVEHVIAKKKQEEKKRERIALLFAFFIFSLRIKKLELKGASFVVGFVLIICLSAGLSLGIILSYIKYKEQVKKL